MIIPVTREISGREVVAHCAAGQEHAAEDVLTALARIPTAAAVTPGFRFHFGWSTFTLLESGGQVVMCEPDFDGDALRATRPRIDVSLDVIAKQIAVLRRAGAHAADARFDDMVLVERGALDMAEIGMRREPPRREGDSGWRILRLGEASAPLRSEQIVVLRQYELLRHRPVAVSAAPLPVGYAVIIAAEHIVSIRCP